MGKDFGFLSRVGRKYLEFFFGATALIMILSCFMAFRYAEQSSRDQVSQNISMILRNEIKVSNSYALSKTLVDFENIGIFKCARLTELDEGKRVFYDTVLGKRCDSGIFSKLTAQSYKLNGLNGVSYELYFIPYLNIFAYLFEGLIYVIIFILGVFIPRYLFRRIRDETAKSAILEIERKALSDLAKQVSHDVASPLSAIRMMTSLMHGIDPEIKDVLNKSLKRTQDIFEDLKQRKDMKKYFAPTICMREIVNEKKIQWAGQCEISLVLSDVESAQAIGYESDFKRIVSNIMNNSFESIPSQSPGRILISLGKHESTIKVIIKDNGIGMSAETLAKLGTQGFSLGKDGSDTSGNGLGVFHAMVTIRQWGGSIMYDSKVGQGTTAEISLNISE